jgi:hypothetical protein
VRTRAISQHCSTVALTPSFRKTHTCQPIEMQTRPGKLPDPNSIPIDALPPKRPADRLWSSSRNRVVHRSTSASGKYCLERMYHDTRVGTHCSGGRLQPRRPYPGQDCQDDMYQPINPHRLPHRSSSSRLVPCRAWELSWVPHLLRRPSLLSFSSVRPSQHMPHS